MLMAFNGIIAAEGSKANRSDGSGNVFLNNFIGKIFVCERNRAVQ